MDADYNRKLDEVISQPRNKGFYDDGESGGLRDRGKSNERMRSSSRRVVFADQGFDGSESGRRNGGPAGRRRGAGKGGEYMDMYSLSRDVFYRDAGFPDIIDVRPLMSSREELVLPKEELFTANDIRSLVILPFSKK